jgi:hypothetical protein
MVKRLLIILEILLSFDLMERENYYMRIPLKLMEMSMTILPTFFEMKKKG